MKLLSERAQVIEVAARWRSQYGRGSIARRLDALDTATASAADVEAIIGNNSWVTQTECHECGTSSWVVVELGEPPDYESSTARICVDCLRRAVALADGG